MQLEKAIKNLPTCAGVYEYFDKDGHLLYVGKAKNLSNRVRSYFNFSPTLRANDTLSIRIKKMIGEAVSLNYIVVNSEHDALILENSLIKQLNPKYNILLRDDKTYPYIYLDNSLEYPRFGITRKIMKTKDMEYFGPYSVGAKDIVDSIYELCRLVQRKGSLKSKKLCLYYQMKKCFGPCEKNVSSQTYKKEVELGLKFIKNKTLLVQKLEEKMNFYAENLRFEEAGELRDRVLRIKRSQIKSEIDFATDENYDVFVLQSDEKRVVVVRVFMRNGKIISSSHDYINLNNGYDENELYQRVLLEFYTKEKPPIVAPILVSSEFEDMQIVSEHLSSVFEKKAHINVPKRGKKKQLVDLAILNAKELLRKNSTKDNSKILYELKELFTLEKTPFRVEVFDNSHMSGEACVGAMVVWENGGFDKKSYRTYHLEARDEYAQMKETLTRRVESFSKNSPPDLWVLDGGATLLSLAVDILQSFGVFVDVIAISKEKVDAKAHRAKGKANDIVYTKNEVFRLVNSDKRLQWVQNLRDEAHRSAIGFHKKTKLKNDKESKLLSLYGISQAKIKKLLNHFGTFEELKRVNEADICNVLNKKDAQIIKNFYS